MELCRWSAGPTSWATSCVTVESNLSCFLIFRTLSRVSCASSSLSRWNVSVSGSSRDRSFFESVDCVPMMLDCTLEISFLGVLGGMVSFFLSWFGG